MREKGFILAQFEGTWGPVRKWRDEGLLSLSFIKPGALGGMVSPTFRVGPPPSVNLPVCKHPPRHTQPCAHDGSVRLIVKINC